VKTNVEALEGDQVRLTVTVEKEEIDRRIGKTYKDFAKKYKFPGFRPGKAPRPVVDNFVGREAVLATVTEEAVNDNYPLALDAEDLIAIEDPEFENEDAMVEEGKDFDFSAKLTLEPKLELSSYDPVEIDLMSDVPTDEDVEERLDAMREYYYDLEDAPADQVIGDRGVAELTMSVTDDKGNPVNVLSTENRLYEIGMGLYPQTLDEELAKLKTGDHKVIDCDLSESMNGSLLTRALDGNPEHLTFDVTVNAVKTKVLPELTEEFATEKAGFKSLEDMRNRTRDDMQHERQEYMDRMKENACLRELGKRLQGEAPQAMCDDERRTLLQGFFQQLQQQKITYDQYLHQRDLTNEQFQEDVKKQAVDVVTQNLAIDAYARHFKMEVTDEMIDEEFKNSGNEDPEALKAEWVKEGRIRLLRQSIMRAEAVDRIMEEAIVNTVTAKEFAAKNAEEEKADAKADSKKGGKSAKKTPAAKKPAAKEGSKKGKAAPAKKVTKTELNKMKVAELRDKAAELKVDVEGMKKAEIVDALYAELNK
jgi:trigger factor